MTTEYHDSPVTLTEAQLKAIVSSAIEDMLTRLGVDASNPVEMQRDFQHLREWRQATGEIQRKGMLTIVGIAFAGLCGAIWLGLKGMFLQH